MVMVFFFFTEMGLQCITIVELNVLDKQTEIPPFSVLATQTWL